jgi:hypothetical protein
MLSLFTRFSLWKHPSIWPFINYMVWSTLPRHSLCRVGRCSCFSPNLWRFSHPFREGYGVLRSGNPQTDFNNVTPHPKTRGASAATSMLTLQCCDVLPHEAKAQNHSTICHGMPTTTVPLHSLLNLLIGHRSQTSRMILFDISTPIW